MSPSIVLTGGRVIDPESGFDAVADVAVQDGRVTGVSTAPLDADRRVDVAGLVVSPGFVDLHSHGQAVPEHRLQALDGVSTTLELEAGAMPVAAAYAQAAAEGRPLNYGYATSWALARMIELAGVEEAPGARTILRRLGDPAWQAEVTAAERDRILGRLYRDLADGALGIGVLLGYAPLVDPAEYLAVARLAADAGTPTFTHARALIEVDPDVPVDGAEEIVRAAGETGAHMHYCHVNSTSAGRIDRVLALVEHCRAEGSVVTTEAYPYGAGSTAIGAGFLHPEALAAQGLRPDSVVAVATGERMADARRLLEVRAADPGALAILHFLDETDAADRAHLERALLFGDTAIASDAMPLTWAGAPPDPMAWPLPPGALTHPRTAGTFGKAVRTLFREHGLLTLPEVIARCSPAPARVLEKAVPAMRRKGRLARGSDADIVVFDPERFADRSTYSRGAEPSAGVAHLLVNGEFVVHEGKLVPGALPGRPVRR